jgi:predicted RNase H-like nuclease (RuvC/YqgF family)
MYVKSLHYKGYNDTQVLGRLLDHRQIERIGRKRITREKKLDLNSLRRQNKNLRGKITQIKVRILENEDELANINDRNKNQLKLKKENRMLTEKVALLKDVEEFKVISKVHEPKKEAIK